MKFKLDIKKNYDFNTKIGEGTYGLIYKIISSDNMIFASKRISNDKKQISKTVLSELILLHQLNKIKNKNIINLIDVYLDKQHIYIVMEYISMNLRDFYQNYKEYSKLDIKKIMYQILNGLNFIHSNKIIHRDLKPQNILIDNDFNIKIIDFGISIYKKCHNIELDNSVQTIWYRAPEILLGANIYDNKIDIWSVGCIIAELINKKPLFSGLSPKEQLDKYINTFGVDNLLLLKCDNTPESLNEIMNNIKLKKDNFIMPLNIQIPNVLPIEMLFISELLMIDPYKRLSTKQALNHSYFNDIPENNIDYNLNQEIESFNYNFLNNFEFITTNHIRKAHELICLINIDLDIDADTEIHCYYILYKFLKVCHTNNYINITLDELTIYVVVITMIYNKLYSSLYYSVEFYEKFLKGIKYGEYNSLMKYECNLLHLLDFDIIYKDPYDFISEYGINIDVDMKLILILGLYNLEVFNFKSSIIAYSAIYIKMIFDKKIKFQDELDLDLLNFICDYNDLYKCTKIMIKSINFCIKNDIYPFITKTFI